MKPESDFPLDPQPIGWGLSCVRRYDDHRFFDIYEGNEMDGHVLVGSYKTPIDRLAPEFDSGLKIWIWVKPTPPAIEREGER